MTPNDRPFAGWLRVPPGPWRRIVVSPSESECARKLDMEAAKHPGARRWIGLKGIHPRRVLRY